MRAYLPAPLIILGAILCLSGCGGGGSATKTPAPPATATATTIASVDAAAAAEPYLAGNTVQYYCDCQSGAAADCTAGDDATGDGSRNAPYQTLDAAMTWLNGGDHRTAALCRGGSFKSAHTSKFVYTFGSTSCPPGTLCNELREYPIGGTDAKPLITNLAGSYYLFTSVQNATSGGWRFMNLKLQGSWDPSTNENWGFVFTTFNTGTYIHDVDIENVDMDHFNIAVNDSVNASNNIKFVGNHVTNSANQGFLGGNSNLSVNYNSFVNNGSNTTFNHSIYVGTNNPVSTVSVVGNFLSGFSTANSGTQCIGEPLVGHAAITDLTVSGNVIVEDTTANGQCYGISFSNGNSPGAVYYRNALFSDNIVVNGGSLGIAVDNCPDCMIENNLIIKESNDGGRGIASPTAISRPSDDAETHATIVNNTVYFGVNSRNGMNGGITVGPEGSGYVVANNTVMYSATASGADSSHINGAFCFDYQVPNSAIAYSDYNNCLNNATDYTGWNLDGAPPGTNYDFATWKTTSGFDAHSSNTDPGWSFATPLAIPALDETKTGAELFAPFFKPSGTPLVGSGNAAKAPARDITGKTRPNPPAIGAYE